MSATQSGMAAAMGGGKFKELRQRIFFLIGALLVFRIGSYITVPGIDPEVLVQMVEQQRVLSLICSTCSQVVLYPACHYLH